MDSKILYFSLWGAFHVAIFNTVLFMLLMSHARAVFSDPGIVPLPQSSLDFSDMYAHTNKTTLQKVKHVTSKKYPTPNNFLTFNRRIGLSVVNAKPIDLLG